MVHYKRKKNSRLRGSKTHGWGAMKKHRGAGNRGGRGNSSTGKRSDARKPTIWGDTKYFGKYGFKNKNANKVAAVNISFLVNRMAKLVSEGKAAKQGDAYAIDLKDLGFDKLLSKGNASIKMNVKARYASAKAAEKIRAAGGSIEAEIPSGDEKEADAEENKN